MAICESSRSPSRSTAIPIFCTLSVIELSTNSGGPIGAPRKPKPSDVEGMSAGRGFGRAAASCGMNRRDFLLFRWRPRAGPSSSTIWRALARSAGVPQRVPSSRYQTLMLRVGTSLWIFSTMGCKARAKANGPRGSPCCTPHWLIIV